MKSKKLAVSVQHACMCCIPCMALQKSDVVCAAMRYSCMTWTVSLFNCSVAP